MELQYSVKDNNCYKTIRDILISYFKMSHRLLVTLKKNNCILLNNKPTYLDKEISIGDVIDINLGYNEDSSNIVPTKMDLNIVYEDDWFIVINKPAGIPVHPSINHYEDSLSNGLKYYYNSIGLNKKIRPVNRIDKNTSGLVIFAKNEYIQECLINQMKDNTLKKEYIAIVEGRFKDKTGTINLPISRKENSIIERTINDNGDISITHYEVLKEININNNNNNNETIISVVKCILETGRTHQIRVHMSYINHPLLGDDLYKGKTDLINRQALHSYKVSFLHPVTKEHLSYECELPDDMNKLVNM